MKQGLTRHSFYRYEFEPKCSLLLIHHYCRSPLDASPSTSPEQSQDSDDEDEEEPDLEGGYFGFPMLMSIPEGRYNVRLLYHNIAPKLRKCVTFFFFLNLWNIFC